jgi:hypothetical protein
VVTLPHVELDSKVREELIALAAKLKGKEKLQAEGQMNKYVEVFRDRFGPSDLVGLDGADRDGDFPMPKLGTIAAVRCLQNRPPALTSRSSCRLTSTPPAGTIFDYQ